MKIAVTTPNSETDPGDVVIEEIELPPVEDWPEEVKSAVTASSFPQSGDEPARPEVALRFVVPDTVSVSIPLKFPFEWDGTVVDVIQVRRLTIGQVDAFVRRARGGSYSTFEVYAEMIGLPVDVLRGLIEEDGRAVTDAAYDFLPLLLRPDAE